MTNVRVHLVAAPWASPALPSIQTGALKAHLRRVFEARVDVSTYAPFLTIPHAIAGDDFRAFFDRYSAYGETLYLLLYARRYGLPEVAKERAVAALEKLLPPELFDALEAATLRFVDETLLPRLDDRAVNLIGFTTNYDQVFSSCFMLARILERAPAAKVVFAFGGASILLPEVSKILRRLELDVWYVFGEGERKLERIIECLLSAASLEEALERSTLEGVHGVVHASAPVNLYEIDRTMLGDRSVVLTEQRLPDFDEFFATLSEATGATAPAHLQNLSLPIEGSRGCFVACDFCGLNYEYSGFRKKPAAAVVASALEASRRHGVPRITFIDNVCDTWAESFADDLRRLGVRLPAFMELRAHHNEAFWTKLALAGVDRIQVGIEALSAPLLARMKKLTRVAQNVAAQKYLVELGILSGSNLLGHHPLSTIDDVEETKRVVSAIPHLGPFALSIFRLTIGSPLYDGLSPEERRSLEPYLPVSLSEELDAWQPAFYYLSPPSLAPPPEVRDAWEEFRVWYTARERPSQPPTLTVVSHHPSTFVIRDAREAGSSLEAVLEGNIARVYDACHRPMKLAPLATELGLPPNEVRSILDALVERKWTLLLADSYLSIAVRPRDVLIQNLLSTRRVSLELFR